MVKKVKKCFGRYGDKDAEIRIGKELKLSCNMLCPDFPLCKTCYFQWWGHHRPGEKEIREFIRKFMKSARLIFKNSF